MAITADSQQQMKSAAGHFVEPLWPLSLPDVGIVLEARCIERADVEIEGNFVLISVTAVLEGETLSQNSVFRAVDKHAIWLIAAPLQLHHAFHDFLHEFTTQVDSKVIQNRSSYDRSINRLSASI